MRSTDWILSGCCFLTLTLAFGLFLSTPEEGGRLAPTMARMHTYSAKLGYAVEARNQRLAAFYLHELEELVEEVIDTVPEHDGHAVAGLARSIALPAVARLEAAVDRGAWRSASESYRGLIASCNTCHLACAKGFVQIEPASGAPPFNQRFAEAVAAPAK